MLRLASAAALLAVLAGCASAPVPAPHGGGRLVHVVAFWLRPEAPRDLPDKMREFYLSRVAREVPGVESVSFGQPHPSAREVVDDSFTCMSVVRFASAQAEAGWQTHPVHDELRRLFGDHLARAVVYDFVE